MTSVAVIGPDGVGKSTVAHHVVGELPSAAYAYLGTNPAVRPLLLPTTRFAARWRGGVTTTAVERDERVRRRGPSSAILRWIRMVVWLSEELARGAEARLLERRIGIVIRDRDFLLDRVAVAGRPTVEERVHRWVLRHLYPRPDLAVVLDAPAEVAIARKADLGPAEAEVRRQGYLALDDVPVVVVDATLPPHEIAAMVVSAIEHRFGTRQC